MLRQVFRTAGRSAFTRPRVMPAFRQFSKDADLDKQMKREEAELMAFDKKAAAAKKPSLVIFSPAGAYAQSILDAATENKFDPKAVHSSLIKWCTAYQNGEELRRFMGDESITWDGVPKDTDLGEHANKEGAIAGKAALLEKHVYPKLGFKSPSDQLAKEAIALLLEDGKIALMSEVAADFERLALHQLKQVKCVVTSAETLSSAYQKKVQAKVQEMAPKGFKPLIDYEVDTSLLGGLTVLVGDKFQDLSARSAILDGETTLRSM